MMLEHYIAQMSFACSKHTIWTYKGGLTMVIRMDQDLMITRVIIQVAEEGVVSQHL
jgi:hypothetical protein